MKFLIDNALSPEVAFAEDLEDSAIVVFRRDRIRVRRLTS